MKKEEIIKETVSQLLKKMGVEAQLRLNFSPAANLVVEIETSQAAPLIGQAGTHLEALQHLARLLVNKRLSKEGFKEPVLFILDINAYRQHRYALLKELAENMAKQALSQKTTLVLQPMPAYERRIIHLTLANHSQVKTESINQGAERRIVIKPLVKE